MSSRETASARAKSASRDDARVVSAVEGGVGVRRERQRQRRRQTRTHKVFEHEVGAHERFGDALLGALGKRNDLLGRADDGPSVFDDLEEDRREGAVREFAGRAGREGEVVAAAGVVPDRDWQGVR